MQLVAQQRQSEALTCIRKQLQPLAVWQEQLHRLVSALLCQSEEDLRQHTHGWPGPGERGWQVTCLMEQLQVRTPGA